MSNVYAYDEKAAYDERYRFRHTKTTSYSSNSSTSSSNSCNDEKCNDCNANNTRPHSYPAVPHLRGERRVRFMVEKPLPPGWVTNWNWEVAQKRGKSGAGFGGREAKDKKRSRKEREDAWWANGGQGLVPYDSDDEEDGYDENAEKETEES
jgi:hypothetical protein